MRTSLERVPAGTARSRFSTVSVRSLPAPTHVPVSASRRVLRSPICVTRLSAHETPVISVSVTMVTPRCSSVLTRGSITCRYPDPVGSQNAGLGLRTL